VTDDGKTFQPLNEKRAIFGEKKLIDFVILIHGSAIHGSFGCFDSFP
jgi:hypothetical protein